MRRRRSSRRRGAASLLLLILAVALTVVILALVRPVAPPPSDEEGQADQTSTIGTPTGREGALGSGVTATSPWHRLYFTAPIYPDQRANHRGGIDTHLVELMDSARTSIDVADYDFDLEDVAQAMARARQRGVRVRMVTDTDTLTSDDEAIQAAFGILDQAGIPIVDDRRPAIMHDKYTVIDGEWVATGSWNYTDGDTYRLNNNLIVIQSRDLAANYTADFERMFNDKEFGAAKGNDIPHPDLTIQGTPVRNCFSPGGDCARKIVRAIDGARQSIEFMAYSFTNDDIGAAMLDRAAAGVAVRGVFETTGSNTRYSEYGKMKDAGLDVFTDGNPWSMHHKVIIIDGRTVVFGSFNFSANADESNDENLLIIDDPHLAAAFQTEFERVLDVAQNPAARE